MSRGRFFVVTTLVATFLLCGFTASFTAEKPLVYPKAQKSDQVDDYHGTRVPDPYRWLEDDKSPETQQWIEAQVKLANEYLSKIPVRQRIKERITELWNYERISTPTRAGKYYFFFKNDGLQEHSIVYIQEGMEGKPEVFLDPHTFSTDGSVSLADFSISHDDKYVGYGISRGGSDWREFYVMDIASRKKLDDHIEWVKFSSMSWYKDGFFYGRYDTPKEGEQLKAQLKDQKLFYHKLGTPQSEDKLIYQDKENPLRMIYSQVTDDEKHLFIYTQDGSSPHNLLYYKDLEKDSPFVPIIDKLIGSFYVVDVVDGKFLLVTNYNAPNSKLIRVDPLKLAAENWEDVIPMSKNKMEGVSYVGGRLISSYLQDANTALYVHDLDGKVLHEIKLPGIGSAGISYSKSTDNEVFLIFTSFTVPSTIYKYDIAKDALTFFRKPEIKCNPDDFIAKQVFAESKDGTKVPLFIVHKKDMKLDGKRPTMLYAYGGFNSSMTPRFSVTILPLLENGGVYALACLRGGGEYGEDWHNAGKLEKKQNVYDDFIGCCEYLIKSQYTSPANLAIYGGSNGGLLVGAVTNQRPDLIKVAIASVGVMDMLRYHKFTVGFAWASEYGISDNPDHFKFLYAYSPLHNIKENTNYPAVLAITADHDDRVFPAHSFKYIATLQEKYKGENPVIIRIETKGGHSGASATSKRIEQSADIYAFMLHNMGITEVK